MVKGGGYKYEKELVDGIKASTKPIVSAVRIVLVTVGISLTVWQR